MAQHRHAQTVVFADDGYVDSEIKKCLLILAELYQAFKKDCGLDLQLGKCKLYIKGMSLIDARALVRDILNDDPRLRSISYMLQLHDDQSKNVIQVQGVTCVGVPIVCCPSSQKKHWCSTSDRGFIVEPWNTELPLPMIPFTLATAAGSTCLSSPLYCYLVLSFLINPIGASDQAWGAIATIRGLVPEP